MSFRQLAIPFFSRHLPAPIVEIIDLSRIETVRESFIDRELAELISDMVFSVPRKDIDGDAFIYTLVEHKFGAGGDLPVPVTVYQLEAMRHFRRVRESKKYPLVIPILLYHDEPDRRFDGPQTIRDCIEGSPELIPFPSFPAFHLIDLAAYTDEELSDQAWTAIFQLVLKHIHNPEIMTILADLIPFFVQAWQQQSGAEFLVTVFTYLMSA